MLADKSVAERQGIFAVSRSRLFHHTLKQAFADHASGTDLGGVEQFVQFTVDRSKCYVHSLILVNRFFPSFSDADSLRTYPQISFAVSHPVFRPSLTTLQSQNPRRRLATPAVLLNHVRQI